MSATSEACNHDWSHNHEAEQPLQDSDRRLENVGLREEKTLNIDTYPRNIRREEFEYTPSEDNSSAIQRSTSGQHPILYKFRHRTVWMAVIVALVISILSISLSVYSVVKYGEAVTELKVARENRGKVCLPCKEQALVIPAWKQRNEAGECCVELQEVLFMVAQIAEEQASKEVQKVETSFLTKFVPSSNSSSAARRRLSAHLVLSKDPDGLSWKAGNSELGHIMEGLVHSPNGYIKIMRAGYYYIYSQLTLADDDLITSPPVAFKYTIIKEEEASGGGVRALMVNSNMMWQSRLQRSYTLQAGYVGGTFFLNAGASVYINLSTIPKELLEPCVATDCFFGLYQL